MAKKIKLTPKQWGLVADRLNVLCNYANLPESSVVVKVCDNGIHVVPAPGANQSALYCVEDITDISRAFGLSFYISYNPYEGHICAYIF